MDLKLDDFHASKFENSKNAADQNTCPVVVAKLRDAVRFIALDLDSLQMDRRWMWRHSGMPESQTSRRNSSIIAQQEKWISRDLQTALG